MQDFIGLFLQDRAVLAKHLNHDLTVNLGNTLQHVIANRLGKTRFDSRNHRQGVIHLLDELFLGDFARPFRGRLQIDEQFGHVDQLGIGAVFGAARFGDDRFDFRKLAQDFAHASQLLRGFGHRNAGRQIDVEPHRSLVQLRQEFGAQSWRAHSRTGR